LKTRASAPTEARSLMPPGAPDLPKMPAPGAAPIERDCFLAVESALSDARRKTSADAAGEAQSPGTTTLELPRMLR